MNPLQDRLIAYITASQGLVSLDKLVDKAKSAGFLEDQVLQALERIGKKLKSTVRGGVVYYQVAPAPKAPTDHLAWVNANYPRYEYEMPFPEISYAHLFLKTKEERDSYLAEAKGMPVFLLSKKKYGN